MATIGHSPPTPGSLFLKEASDRGRIPDILVLSQTVRAERIDTQRVMGGAA